MRIFTSLVVPLAESFIGPLLGVHRAAVDGGGDVERGKRHDDQTIRADHGAEHFHLALLLLRRAVTGGDFDFNHRAEEQHGVLVGGGEGERLVLERTVRGDGEWSG